MAAYRYITIYHTTNLTAYRLITVGQDQVIIGMAGQHVGRLADRMRDTIQLTPGDSFAVTQIEDLCQRFIRHFQETYQKKYQVSFTEDVLEGIGILWLTNQATGRGYQWGKCRLIAIGNPSSHPLVSVSGQIEEFNVLPDTRLVIDLYNTDIASFVAALPAQAFTKNKQELVTDHPYSFSATLIQTPTDDISPPISTAVSPVSVAQPSQPIAYSDGPEIDHSTHKFSQPQPLVTNWRQVTYVGGLIGLILIGWLGWQQQRDQSVSSSLDSLSLVRPLTQPAAESELESVVVAPQHKSPAITSTNPPSTLEQDTIARTQEQQARLSLLLADRALERADVCIQHGQNRKARTALYIADKNYRIYLQLKPNQTKMLRLRMNKLNQLRLVVSVEESE